MIFMKCFHPLLLWKGLAGLIMLHMIPTDVWILPERKGRKIVKTASVELD